MRAGRLGCGPDGWGALSFDRREPHWSVRYWMYPNQAPVLTFRFNPRQDPAAVANLQVIVDIPDETVRPLADYLPGSLAPDTWVDVRIPLLDIATDFSLAHTYRLISETALVPAGLAPETAYVARVRAEGPAGPSAWTDLGRFETGDPLPVELVSFSAVADGAGAVLSWVTASETNNAGFAVEMRPAGEVAAAWREVAFVEGNGTTAEARRYAYHVRGLPAGVHRFRLRQVDYEGAFETSFEVEVGVGGTRVFDLHPVAPNPVTGTATLRFTVGAADRAMVTVYDALGRRVATAFEGDAAPGVVHAVAVDAGALAAGLYVVRLEAATGVVTRSFVVVH